MATLRLSTTLTSLVTISHLSSFRKRPTVGPTPLTISMLCRRSVMTLRSDPSFRYQLLKADFKLRASFNDEAQNSSGQSGLPC